MIKRQTAVVWLQKGKSVLGGKLVKSSICCVISLHNEKNRAKQLNSYLLDNKC